MESLTQEDYTTDEVIDSFQKGDNTIDIVGIVTFTHNNFNSPAKYKFKRIVYSNGSQKNVQIIAWNELVSKLDSVRVGNGIFVSSVKYNIPKSKDFNSGNVAFELLVKTNTVVQIFDARTAENEPIAEDFSIPEEYDKIGIKIKLDAIVKTEPGEYIGKSFSTISASITDGDGMLELKFGFNSNKLKFSLLKGMSMGVVKVMERYSDGPPTLLIDSPDNIKLVDRPRILFLDVLKGFRTKTKEILVFLSDCNDSE